MSTQLSVESLCALSAEELAAPQHWSCDAHPVELWIGRGSLRGLLDQPRLPALVIGTEHSVMRSRLEEAFSAHPRWHVFNGIRPNPTPDLIERAAQYAREREVETIVGLGGGSALDAARCVSLMLGRAETVAELRAQIEAESAIERTVDLVQVPTTAGTGAEVTPWASVWSPSGSKSSVDHPTGFSDRAYIDPRLTDSMPPRLTAAVGLDALTHAMESLWGRHGNAVAHQLASRAIQLIDENLEPAITAPTKENRNAMTLGALLAGMALSKTRSAIAHALSYQLTGEHQLEHGLAVGLIALAVLRLPSNEAPPERDRVIAASGYEDASGLAQTIERAFKAIEVSPSLTALGIPSASTDGIIQTALSSNRLSNMSGSWDAERLSALLSTIH